MLAGEQFIFGRHRDLPKILVGTSVAATNAERDSKMRENDKDALRFTIFDWVALVILLLSIIAISYSNPAPPINNPYAEPPINNPL